MGNRGSIVVEAAFIFSFLIILSFGIWEYGSWLSIKSQVERVNYSIASVVKERFNLYGKREVLTNNDVKEIYELAKVLTLHRYDSNLCVRVESIHFAGSDVKKISSQQKIDYGSSLCKSLTTKDLKNKINLSPYSSRGRWLPLYQVSLIVPMPKGAINSLLGNVELIPSFVSAHTILLER